MRAVNGDAIWFVFQIFSVFLNEYQGINEICISNDYGLVVFQLSFEPKKKHGKLFSIIWDIECCLLNTWSR